VVASPSVALATLVGVDPKGRVVVALDGGAARVVASVSSHVDPIELRRAIAAQRQVVVAVARAGARASARPPVRPPVIIGLVEDRIAARGKEAVGAADGAPELDARVDGRRVRLVAEEEIVLECGKASITLRRNGRVVVRGTHVQTDSDGANLVRGAQVRIN